MPVSVCEFKVCLVCLASSGWLGPLNETLSLIFFLKPFKSGFKRSILFGG